MQEDIGYAAETETPCVIINVMRGGPSTGQPTLSAQQDVLQAKYGSHGDYELNVLCPSSVQEIFELTLRAFNLAEKYRVPAIVLSDEIVIHTREKLRIPFNIDVRERLKPKTPPETYKPYKALPSGLLDGMPTFGEGYRMLVDGQLHNEEGNRAGSDPIVSGKLVQRLCRKITDHAAELVDVETLYTDDAHTIVVVYGSVARSALSAVKMARQEGLKAGLLKIKILWPFPDQVVRKTIQNARKVIVPEMNVGKIFREVQRVHNNSRQIFSLPKLGGMLHTSGEILEAIKSEHLEELITV